MATTRCNTLGGKLAAAAVLTGAALTLLSGCTKSSETNAPEPKTVRCETADVQLEEIPRDMIAVGSLEAETSIMISTRMMGWVKKIHIAEGQPVRKGAPLLSIDDTDLLAKKAQAEAGIAEAKAVLANAEKMAERFENLYAAQAVSKQQLDDVLTGRDRAAAGLEMAKAGLREVNVHLGYVDIVAPVDGIVGRKMIEAGDMANPGMPLLILEDTARIKVVAHVGEKDISSLRIGDPVRIDVTSLDGAVYQAEITKIVPTANPGSRTYDIETSLDNTDGRLRSGMFARVVLHGPAAAKVLVPSTAIIRRGQLTGVWLVRDDETAHLRWIRLGRPHGDRTEALSGLAGGETVVLSSQQPLAEGDKVVK